MEKLSQKQSESLLDNRRVLVAVLFMALIFNVIFGCLRNPLGEDNTISWIGYDHPIGFLFWGALTGSAFFLNILHIYRKYGYTGKIGTVALYAAPFMACSFVFINDWGWEHVVHWIGAIGFIALNGAAILLFLLHNFKKHISYKITTFAVALMLLSMLVILLTVGKSGLLELIPIWLALILLFLINCTDFYPVIDKKETTPKAKDNKKAAKLAMCLGMFGADDFYLGKFPQGEGHLLMTVVGVMICVDRFIGMGVMNDISGESAVVFLAVGLSILCGSAAWAIYNGAVLRKEK